MKLQIAHIYLGNGERLAYRKIGLAGKPKLLLLHGQLSSGLFFEEIMQQLKERYELLAIDLRGCGGSSYMRPFDSFAELAVDVEQALQLLNFSDCYVLGWSFGGAVAMELAFRLTSIKGCILLGSVAPNGYASLVKKSKSSLAALKSYAYRRELRDEKSINVKLMQGLRAGNVQMAKEFYDGVLFNQTKPEAGVLERYAQEVLRQKSFVDYELAMLRFNISSQDNGFTAGSGHLAKLKCPLLILHGKEDKVIDANSWLLVQEHDKTIDLKLLESCGHAPLIDQKEQVLAAIDGFVA